MTQLALTGWLAPGLPDGLRQSYERAAEHVRHPEASNTRRTYESKWAAWAKHCAALEHLDIVPLPIAPGHLVGYLQNLSDEGAAPNTVRLHLAALCALDAGHALSVGDKDRPPLRKTYVVQRWLKGWSRLNPVAPRRRASAITRPELVRVVETAQEPGFNACRAAHTVRYARDRAMLAIGVAGALRISELIALDLSDVTASPVGLRIVVRRAKNDQSGEGQVKVVLPQAKKIICPVEAFLEWQRARGAVPGPLFCAISRGGELALGAGLSERQGMRIVTDRCQAAGLVHVTSHSMRATFYTLSKGKPLSDVMAHAGSKSVKVALGYQRQGELYDPEENPTAGLFG